MRLGIRAKLIGVFIVIKVVPLILLGIIAWEAIKTFSDNAREQTLNAANDLRETITEAGELTIADTVQALDDTARESIERLSTDMARNVARFLYQRDNEILFAGSIKPNKDLYRKFLDNLTKRVSQDTGWSLNDKGDAWVKNEANTMASPSMRHAKLKQNEKDFHYRIPENQGLGIELPLYREMTYVSLDGHEIIKITTDQDRSTALKDISKSINTFAKAENYFSDLKKLKPGEVFVSNVIGIYQKTTLIGPYTKTRTDAEGLPFEPQNVAYAGKENPQGKRFEGIVRWATPVTHQGVITGYVTLALDHRHIMNFSDHNLPTDERYSNISDASSGNYAFMWDYKGRNISHPRDYFIAGYDAETGKPAVPWLSDRLNEAWKASKLPYHEFEKTIPWFQKASEGSKPALELKKQGKLALDCRFLNFAPQCAGWWNLTQEGGSGSFVIFWSGLWKLTTAAAIPYYTGRYADSKRGFGFITIGANVDDFHRTTNETRASLKNLIKQQETKSKILEQKLLNDLSQSLSDIASNLTFYTVFMSVVVILIAIWMANALSARITRIIISLRKIKEGDLSERAVIDSRDEMGELANSLNSMTESLQNLILRNKEAVKKAEAASSAKSDFLANMSHELRTPLNAIIGFSNIMQSELLGAIKPKEYRGYVDDIHTSGEHLLALINDVLDAARVGSGEVEIDEEIVNVAKTIDETISMLSASADRKHITITSDVKKLPLVYGDIRRLKQVFLNILSNAVKFTPDGGAVIFKAFLKVTGDLEIRISDTGIGMNPADIEIALKPFAQVQTSLSREYEGTGLGLPLSQNLIELHEGHLEVISELHKGTEIVITLPKSRMITS